MQLISFTSDHKINVCIVTVSSLSWAMIFHSVQLWHFNSDICLIIHDIYFVTVLTNFCSFHQIFYLWHLILLLISSANRLFYSASIHLELSHRHVQLIPFFLSPIYSPISSFIPSKLFHEPDFVLVMLLCNSYWYFVWESKRIELKGLKGINMWFYYH